MSTFQYVLNEDSATLFSRTNIHVQTNYALFYVFLPIHGTYAWSNPARSMKQKNYKFFLLNSHKPSVKVIILTVFF